MNQQTVDVLVVDLGGNLEEEFEAAARSIRGLRLVTRHVRGYRPALEIARLHSPDLVVVEMATPDECCALAVEMADAVPGAAIVAAYERGPYEAAGNEGDVLIRLARANVQDFLQRQVSAADLQQLLDRLFRRRHRAPEATGAVVSFVSNKGGVGKSVLSVNTAVALAERHPDQVLLIDASLQLGVCASMLDLQPERTIADAAHELERLDDTLLRQLATRHDGGLHVLAAPPDILAASEIDERAMARILAVARRTYRYVVVDTFPLLDAVVIALLDMSERAFVVTQPVVPVVIGAAGLFDALDGLELPHAHVRLVLNRTFRTFPGELSASGIAERLGRPVAHVVPFDKRMPAMVNAGEPAVRSAKRWARFPRAIRAIADEIEQLRSNGGVVREAAPAGAHEELAG